MTNQTVSTAMLAPELSAAARPPVGSSARAANAATPAIPAAPAEPADRADPAGPADPADLADSADPADPVDPGDPAGPANPAAKVNQADPAGTANPARTPDLANMVAPAGMGGAAVSRDAAVARDAAVTRDAAVSWSKAVPNSAPAGPTEVPVISAWSGDPHGEVDHPVPDCPVEVTLRALRGRWTTLVVRELFGGERTFGELADALPALSDKVLSDRLAQLVAVGVVVRVREPGWPSRVRYSLTARGQALRGVLEAMWAWGAAGASTGATAAT